MSSLPHGLTEPLRYPGSAWLLLAAAVLIAGLLLAVLWWWHRRTSRASKAPGATLPPLPAASAKPAGIAAEIEALKRRVVEREAYRHGCHELALLLREYFTRRQGRRLLTLTAREIRARLGEQPLVSLFELLADLQFRRRAPERDDFEGICDLAADTARGKR